jgi:hypothetical protein
MAGGLYLYSGLGAKEEYRAHLGHEQLTVLVKTLRGLRYKEKQTGCSAKRGSVSGGALDGGNRRVVTGAW